MFDFSKLYSLSERVEAYGTTWLIIELLRDGFYLAVETDPGDETILLPADVKLIKYTRPEQEPEQCTKK